MLVTFSIDSFKRIVKFVQLCFDKKFSNLKSGAKAAAAELQY